MCSSCTDNREKQGKKDPTVDKKRRNERSKTNPDDKLHRLTGTPCQFWSTVPTERLDFVQTHISVTVRNPDQTFHFFCLTHQSAFVTGSHMGAPQRKVNRVGAPLQKNRKAHSHHRRTPHQYFAYLLSQSLFKQRVSQKSVFDYNTRFSFFTSRNNESSSSYMCCDSFQKDDIVNAHL